MSVIHSLILGELKGAFGVPMLMQYRQGLSFQSIK